MDNSGLQYDSPQVFDYKKFYDFVINSVVISVLPSHSVMVRSKTYFYTFNLSPNQPLNCNSFGPALQILPVFRIIPYSYPCLLNFPSNHSVVKFY